MDEQAQGERDSEELERVQGGRFVGSNPQASSLYGDFFGLDDIWTEQKE